jgi:glycosyltransferase involved in cell wall biosynthesis
MKDKYLKIDNNINKQSAVIVCHDSVFGPPHELRNYLNDIKIKELLFIGHQNKYVVNNPIKNSYYEYYQQGVRCKVGELQMQNLPEFIGYIRDFIITIFWSLHYMRRIDIFIGLGNLNALVGLILNFFWRSKKVIYYVIDYMPIRFQNRFVNSIYHYVDYVCIKRCTYTWNYSQNMIKAREAHWKQIFHNQLVVPNGVSIHNSNKDPHTINRDLIYIGTLFKKQGIDLVIKTLPKLIRLYPNIKFKIIGHGPYLDILKNLCSVLKVEKYVIFYGFISDPVEADNIIQTCSLGIATYEITDNFVQYTEPGKVKRYLACGIPVIMTNISDITIDVIKYRCGYVIKYSETEFIKKITEYFDHPDKQLIYRKNALQYAKKYTWNKIFSRVFAHMNI